MKGVAILLGLSVVVVGCASTVEEPSTPLATSEAPTSTITPRTTSTGPTTTTTATPTTAAPVTTTPTGPAGDCGTVASITGQVRVVVPFGPVTCDEATDIVDRYFHAPDTPIQGSSAFAQVGEWVCYIDTIPTGSGYLGTCDRVGPDGLSYVIEMHPA